MLSTVLVYLRTELECFLQGGNAFYRVGMLSTELEHLCTELEYLGAELEYPCTGLECLLQGWNAVYRVGMLSTVLEYFRQCWNTFDRVGIPL
jgi:hypothetical protein